MGSPPRELSDDPWTPLLVVFAEFNSIPCPDVPVAICFDPLVDDPRRIRRMLTTMQGGGPEDIAVQVQGFAD